MWCEMESGYRVIISGDRNWTGSELESKMEWLFRQMPVGTIITHGGCKGVDMTADKVACKLGILVDLVPADWERYGRAAGPIRNKQMLDKGPQVVYAFHQKIESSRGTKDMINQTKRRGIPVYLIS